MQHTIHDAIGSQLAGRTLVIVGVAHKWYLPSYLDQMHDVRIVSTGQVLR